MKLSIKFLSILFFSFLTMEIWAATGEVTRSGSTWTAKVDGSTKYTGSDMIDAINACTGNMGSGTINVRNSGTAVAPNGLRSVNLNSNQTLDFHGTTMTCKNPLNVYPVKSSGKSNVAVRNLNIAGVPRYLLHFSGCSGVTISNITANTTRGTGIRVETSSNLVISGNINLRSPGHCIETYTVNGVDIGTVTVRSDNGCGVLLNDSENCEIDRVNASYCDYDGGGYAGFRTANGNGSTHLGQLYADHCGRGYFSVSNSGNCTIDYVEISNCSDIGIWLQDATNTHVNSGYVWNNESCHSITGGSGNSISVSCSAPSGGGSGGGSFYQMTNRDTGNCVGIAGGNGSDNANIEDQSCNNSYWRQQWELIDAGDSYLYIINRNSGKCLRASGSNVEQYTCNDGWWSEMFSRQDVGSGRYLIKNRNTGTCLRALGGDIVLADCNTSYWSEQFSFSGASSSARIAVAKPISVKENSDVLGYPNPATDKYILKLPSEQKSGSYKLISVSGSILQSEKFLGNSIEVNTAQLPAGFYVLEVATPNGYIKKRLVIE